jgi:hypothetical protein
MHDGGLDAFRRERSIVDLPTRIGVEDHEQASGALLDGDGGERTGLLHGKSTGDGNLTPSARFVWAGTFGRLAAGGVHGRVGAANALGEVGKAVVAKRRHWSSSAVS